MSKKRTAAGESILLTKTVGGLYDDVIEFSHAVKADYGSAVNAARYAIESSPVYQDWKKAREEELAAQRRRSAGGQFVAVAEQNVA